MDFATSFFLTGAEIGLGAVGLVLLLATAWGGNAAARSITIAAVAALFGALLFTIASFGQDGAKAAFGGLIVADDFAAVAKCLIYAATILVLIVARPFFDHRGMYRPEFAILLLFNAVGMSIMVSASDLMALYIGLELSSLSSYVLASFARGDDKSSEAGLKYFVLGGLASGILLYGISLVYGFAGTTTFAGIRTAFTAEFSMGATFAVVFVLAGMAFKIAAVPFHMWTPDVYEGAPTPVTAFFASAPKVAAVAMLVRMAVGPFGTQADAWQQIVIFAALASIVVGALGAIGQQNLKRLLAYSSINNVGFILLGLAVANADGVAALTIYLAVYVFMTLGSFVALLILRDETGAPLETFDDISGLATTNRTLAWCLLLLMFSLAGIPPLMGFYSKLVVFEAVVAADLLVLAIIGIAASVIGAFYYIKFVKVMFFDEPRGAIPAAAPIQHWVVLSVCVLLISPLGFFLTPWLQSVAGAAAQAVVSFA